MLQKSSERPNKVSFSYESDETASFLVLACEARVLEYQTLMLEHNRIRCVLLPNVVIKEGKSCFYYNITSKISLSFLLGRRNLTREEFLKIIRDISSTVKDAAGYLLTVSNFVFDPEYIYISPETMEPMLVYAPAALDSPPGTKLQEFLFDLLMWHVNAEGFDGNLIRRLLSIIRSESFNAGALTVAADDMLYSDASYAGAFAGAKPEDENAAAEPVKEENAAKETGRAKGTKDTGNAKESKERCSMEIKNDNSKAQTVKNISGGGKVLTQVMPAIFAQAVMGAAIYACHDFIDKASGNPTAAYAAVIMIVLAVEVVIFKKLNTAKLFRFIRQEEGSASPAPEDMKSDLIDNHSDKISGRKTYLNSAKTAAGRIRDILREQDGRGVNRPLYASDSAYAGNRKELNETPHGMAAPDKAAGTVLSANGSVLQADHDGINAGGAANDGFTTLPAATACGKTELLAKRPNGIRIFKSTREQSGGEDIVIDRDDFIIGRLAGHVDHAISNNAIGKLHAQVLFKNGTCYIKDLNSVNGTFINGARIESNKEYELKENDRILLANSEFVYIIG